MATHLPRLAEWELYLGQGAGDRPVTLSLRDDSPHIAVSAGSGAGKSVLAEPVAVQVLARGGRVVILDRKGSHSWALGLAGVDYCAKPAQMHDALVRLTVSPMSETPWLCTRRKTGTADPACWSSARS
ncbi:helicase HerA domain-containing protein [Micromonospora chokoriensis]